MREGAGQRAQVCLPGGDPGRDAADVSRSACGGGGALGANASAAARGHADPSASSAQCIRSSLPHDVTFHDFQHSVRTRRTSVPPQFSVPPHFSVQPFASATPLATPNTHFPMSAPPSQTSASAGLEFFGEDEAPIAESAGSGAEPPQSDYERKREANIRANNEKLKSLGLGNNQDGAKLAQSSQRNAAGQSQWSQRSVMHPVTRESCGCAKTTPSLEVCASRTHLSLFALSLTLHAPQPERRLLPLLFQKSQVPMMTTRCTPCPTSLRTKVKSAASSWCTGKATPILRLRGRQRRV